MRSCPAAGMAGGHKGDMIMTETDQDWRAAVREWTAGGELLQATLSQPRRKDDGTPARTLVRPVTLKGGLHYQFETRQGSKAIHENLPPEQAALRLLGLMEAAYRQALVKTAEADVQLLFSKKGKAAMLRKPPTAQAGAPASHNRVKQRIVGEGEAAPFLVELGIMTSEGRVHAQKQNKYRQINRFLEMVADVMPALPEDRPIRIIDFGCGKSYLTFALYHLLAVQHGRDVRITGLDLKADVIAFCSALAEKLGYEGLHFLQGDIAEYEGLREADMVVTLHACDTATDAALAKAVRWNASVILSVPCCQHELFGQVGSDALAPILQHGLLKERFASLATDAVRGQLLQAIGYKVQMLEFVDVEHTPKNLLIRAVKEKRGGLNEARWAEYVSFAGMLGLDPALERLLADRLPARDKRGRQ